MEVYMTETYQLRLCIGILKRKYAELVVRQIKESDEMEEIGEKIPRFLGEFLDQNLPEPDRSGLFGVDATAHMDYLPSDGPVSLYPSRVRDDSPEQITNVGVTRALHEDRSLGMYLLTTTPIRNGPEDLPKLLNILLSERDKLRNRQDIKTGTNERTVPNTVKACSTTAGGRVLLEIVEKHAKQEGWKIIPSNSYSTPKLRKATEKDLFG